MENLFLTLAGLGASASIVIQILKKTGFALSMDRPKLTALLFSAIIILVTFYSSGNFTAGNVDKMAIEIVAMTASAIAFYEIVVKPTIAVVKWLIKVLKK